MKAPWPRTGGWPYQGKRGRSWQLGYRDANGKAHARSFQTRELALDWKRGYIEAERHGALAAFIAAGKRRPVADAQVALGEMLLDWLSSDAHPSSPGGLAPATWASYRSVISRHILGNPVMRLLKRTGEQVQVRPAIAPLDVEDPTRGYAIGRLPLAAFADARTLKAWVAGMRAADVGEATEARAFKVLSAALSWAVESSFWPIDANGATLMQRRRGMRRASRRPGSGAKPRLARKRRASLAAWALSPLAAERIRLAMLTRTKRRGELLALRDATAVAIQYGLGMRNQEIWALTFADLDGSRASVRAVLSQGVLDAGKTDGATSVLRRPPIDTVLREQLDAWREALAAHGYPTGPDAFVLRGDLAGHGAGAGHMSGAQAHSWARKHFTPAVNTVAERFPAKHGAIRGATPYSLRRGMISLRIRAGEDRQLIAKQCGTSVEMLERSYSFAIEELEDHGPRSAIEERVRARKLASDRPESENDVAPR